MVAAHDATFGQDVSDLHVFMGADNAFSARYVDFPLEGNTPVVDLSVLSEIEPDLAATAAR